MINVDLSQLERLSNPRSGEPASDQAGDSLATQARDYLLAFAWCPAVLDQYLGYLIPGKFGIFLCRIANSSRTQDEWLWVVVGDVPSAYFVTDRAATVRAALEVYRELMTEWVDAVLAGVNLAQVFPVQADPTPANAALLAQRLDFLKSRVASEL